MTKLARNQDGVAHLLALMAVVVVLAVGGTGYYVMKNSKKASNSERTETETSLQASEVPVDLTGIKTAAEISTIAEASLDGNQIRGVELETEEGVLVYKVKLSNKTVLVFDAKTGAKVSQGTVNDGDFEDDDNLPTTVTTTVTVDQARATAVAEHPNVAVSKIELEMEEGKLVYSVRFTDKARVDVDATTGAIVRTKAAQESGSSSSNSGSGSGSSSSGSHSGSGSGSGSSSSSDDDDSDDDTSSSSTGSTTAGSISESEARTIASNRLPGKTIEKVESETEEGAAVFSVRFTDDSRVDVRASDGVIVRVNE